MIEGDLYITRLLQRKEEINRAKSHILRVLDANQTNRPPIELNRVEIQERVNVEDSGHSPKPATLSDAISDLLNEKRISQRMVIRRDQGLKISINKVYRLKNPPANS